MSSRLARIARRATLLSVLILAFLRPGPAEAQASQDQPGPRGPTVERVTQISDRKGTAEPLRLRRAERPRIDPPRQS